MAPRRTTRWVEVAFFDRSDNGYLIDGHTSALEDGRAWAVHYQISLDGGWHTSSATITGWTSAGAATTNAYCDDSGNWTINGERRADLDGCVDVDLESSAVTNTIPVHRLMLAAGDSAEAPAAYVRAVGLSVTRLDQHYQLRASGNDKIEYEYEAPQFEFQCLLSYDASGLIVSYPDIAMRTM